ncbi:MAG: hypothetical protein H8F28_24545 [Fibrella sp.]|nr:hypothetical protein [Armatimonadota bacterium]
MGRSGTLYRPERGGRTNFIDNHPDYTAEEKEMLSSVAPAIYALIRTVWKRVEKTEEAKKAQKRRVKRDRKETERARKEQAAPGS